MVCGYLIDHPDGPVLLDTGIAEGHEETEEIYHPVRRSLDAGLAAAGVTTGDVRVVVNCHLHSTTAAAIRGSRARRSSRSRSSSMPHIVEEDYPIAGLYDFAEAKYELHGGEADVADGIRIVPTPGHTAGASVGGRRDEAGARRARRPGGERRHRLRASAVRAASSGGGGSDENQGAGMDRADPASSIRSWCCSPTTPRPGRRWSMRWLRRS